MTGTSYLLDNLRLLDRGTFVWQVEAVSFGSGGEIERRGEVIENLLVLDFPSPAPVLIDDPGILYGN
jgi:hypothetical protein